MSDEREEWWRLVRSVPEEQVQQGLAEVFATTPGAIRVRLTRARAALRERMEAGPPPASPIATDEQLDTWARSTRG